jgi:hypothetical protein
MNFKNLLDKINNVFVLLEAPEGPGTATKKEAAKASSTSDKAKDAARKRVERSRETPRERKPKQELIKDVVLVKTRSGTIQLIFKDSFNGSQHEKLNKDVLTIEEAQRVLKDEKFEQTRASKLLFGNVKEKEKVGREKSTKKEEEEARREAKPKTEEEKVKEEKRKATKLSKEQVMQTMTQMTPEQLAAMPPDIRNEYFRMIRKPPANTDFDKMSYENLTVAFGLSNTSGTPYNQQVLNALIFLAKLKAGASEQEVQTYLALAPEGREFTRAAFFTAKKVLSQIGDQCIQNLVTNIETTGKPVNAEGAADMECGAYKFKVSAGGEISLSTTDFDQSNKQFKGYIASALSNALRNPQLIASDAKLSSEFQTMQKGMEAFSDILVPDNLLPEIKNDPKLLQKLQSMPIKDASGKVVGTVIDADGNLNDLASASRYQKGWEESAKAFMKGGTKSNALKKEVINGILKTVLRGDGITDPEMAPNHLITVNGIMPMTDDYFATISQNSNLDVKPSKDVMTSSNISKYKPSSAEMFKKYTTVVEATEEQEKPSLEAMLIKKDSIDPYNYMVNYIVKNNDFLLNASLLPGFSTADLNSVQYNYVTIGKKTIKIPVMKGENISNEVLSEGIIAINDLLLESLSNNFVLSSLVGRGLVTPSEASILLDGETLLTENAEYVYINLQSIFERAVERYAENHAILDLIFEDILEEKYKRDYKMEYRNYHGKPKQRKERAARTAARELMIKKGKVKKGDGKDIDHKKPLRHGGSKGINNLRVRKKSENRSDNGHRKGEKQNKDWK